MAYSFADLSADDIADYTAELPIVLGRSVIADAAKKPYFRAQWRASTLAAGADLTDPTAPASRAYDRLLSRPTKPQGLGTSWCFCVDLSTYAADANNIINYAVLSGHNFATIGGITCVLQVADDEAFSSNLRTIATWNSWTNNARKVDLLLTHAGAQKSYTAVQYLRLLITKDGLTPFTPEIGELYLGARRQLKRQPMLPHDDLQQQSEVGDFNARSGQKTRYVFNRGRKVIKGSFAVVTTEKTPITNWWADILQGSHPFFYVQYPVSSPNTAAWVTVDPSFTLPATSGNNRWWQIVMIEQPPFVQLEGEEVIASVTAMSWAPEYPVNLRQEKKYYQMASGPAAAPVLHFDEDDRLPPDVEIIDPIGGRWYRPPVVTRLGGMDTRRKLL